MNEYSPGYGADGFSGGHLVEKLQEDGIAQIHTWMESQVKNGQKEEQNS